MKINCKQEVKNFEGEALKDESGKVITFGKMLSNILLASPEGGKMKLYVLAERFYKDEVVDLDKVDFGLVKHAVETTRLGNNLVTGQILLALEENAK